MSQQFSLFENSTRWKIVRYVVMQRLGKKLNLNQVGQNITQIESNVYNCRWNLSQVESDLSQDANFFFHHIFNIERILPMLRRRRVACHSRILFHMYTRVVTQSLWYINALERRHITKRKREIVDPADAWNAFSRHRPRKGHPHDSPPPPSVPLHFVRLFRLSY